MLDRAADHLTADLVERRLTGWGHIRHWVLAIIAAAFHDDGPAIYDLVVTRRETGREIMRTPADVGDAQYLLDTVNLDLETKTIGEFVAEWRLIDNPPPA